jgi:putative DNA primase/helicase
MSLRKTLAAAAMDGRLRNLRLTDAGNAEAFELLHGERFRFDHIRSEWLVWSGNFWRIDETGEADRAILETARARQHAGVGINDSDQKKKYMGWAMTSESLWARKAALASAQSLKDLSTRTVEYDSYPFLFAVGNGTLDLRTGRLRKACAADLITRFTSINYSPSAKCPRWLKFLEEVFDGDRELIAFIQRAVGYSMTGETREQCLFILCGSGANGKSTFLELIYEMLGTHAAIAPFSTFLVQRNHGSPRNDIAKLAGARLVKASESKEGGVLDETIVKEMTGGDTVSARFLFHEHFDFRPTFKLWLATNHRPTIRGSDHAIWRRIKLMDFPCLFMGKDCDPTLKEQLRGELDGILAWAVRGCLEWQTMGLRAPAAIEASTSEYRRDSGQVARFVSECCMKGTRCQASGADLYGAYVRWCAHKGEKHESNNLFAKALADLDLKKKRGRRGIKYEGVELIVTRESEPTQLVRTRVKFRL